MGLFIRGCKWMLRHTHPTFMQLFCLPVMHSFTLLETGIVLRVAIMLLAWCCAWHHALGLSAARCDVDTLLFFATMLKNDFYAVPPVVQAPYQASSRHGLLGQTKGVTI